MEGLNDVFRDRASFLLRLSQAFPPSCFAPPLCVRVLFPPLHLSQGVPNPGKESHTCLRLEAPAVSPLPMGELGKLNSGQEPPCLVCRR